jgi:hypothetical protein
MYNSRPRWHDGEVLKRSLSPFQKLESLTIPLKFSLLIAS